MADLLTVIVLAEDTVTYGVNAWRSKRRGQTDLGAAAEAAEEDQESPLPSGVQVTRGHDRAKTLQIRLNEDELADLGALADDLKSALDRLERDVSAVRRVALSGTVGGDSSHRWCGADAT